MNSKKIKGISVISIADGDRLGAIDNVYFDPAAKEVVGFALHAGGGLLSSGAGSIVDAGSVHSLGPDVMTVPDTAAAAGEATSARYGDLVPLDQLAKRKVVTEGGVFVGQVASVDFDDKTFGLTQVEVSPGFFKHHLSVPAAQVVSIGHDVIVVADAVCAPDTADAVTGDIDDFDAPPGGSTVEVYPAR